MRVIGPNGIVVNVREAVATGLVGDGSRGYSYAPEAPARPPKPKRRTARKQVETVD